MSIWFTAVILALGIARLTLIIVKDDIAKHLRHWVYGWSPPDRELHTSYWKATQQERDAGFTVGKRWPLNKYIEMENGSTSLGWWGQVISCPDCAGVYIAAAVLLGYYFLPTATIYVMFVLAASMLTSIIARKY